MSTDADEWNNKQTAEQFMSLRDENRVRALVAGYLTLRRENDEVTPSFRDMKVYRLEFFCLSTDLEATLGLRIPDIEALRFITVGDTVWWILQHPDEPTRHIVPLLDTRNFNCSV